jgi:hypothetical protein
MATLAEFKSPFAGHATQHDCPFSVCPLCQLEVVIVSSFYVAFKCHSLFLSNSEVMNGHGMEKKEINNK